MRRKRALTITTVATEEKAYIFDVHKLGQAVFSAGLAENLKTRKVDVRLPTRLRRSLASVPCKANGLPEFEVIYHRESTSWRPRGRNNIRRSQRTDEVERINGFRHCLELYVADRNYIIVKGKGGDILKRDTEVWKKRPLAEVLLQYCVVDTKAMFKLYDKMKHVSGGDLERLRVASERYVDLYRGRAKRYYDRYETDAYLPLDITPDEGTLDFAPATTACSLCH